MVINTHRIHGAAIYGNMDPINIPPMLAYIIYTIHGSYGIYEWLLILIGIPTMNTNCEYQLYQLLMAINGY